MALNNNNIAKERKKKVAKSSKVYVNNSSMREDILVANLAEAAARVDVLKNICMNEVKDGGEYPCIAVQDICNVFGWNMGTEDKRWR